MSARGPRRIARSGAPAPFSLPLFAAGLFLLAAAGCASLPPAGPAAAPAPPAEKPLPPRFVRVSVYVTDARDNGPVEDAEVVVGPLQLMPTPLPEEYGQNRAGLYVTDDLEGGSYPIRVRRAGYRSLIGRLAVPPAPERVVGHEPPLVLEVEDERESGEALPSLRLMVLWQKYKRGAEAGQEPPHPPTTKPPGRSPHTIVTHPPDSPPPPAPPPTPQQ